MLGVDRAIGFTLIGRVWVALAGVLTLTFVGRCLSPEQQGYFYTFGSLLALQVFVELGLTNVILQFASHERAHLSFASNGVLEGNHDAKSRLASLLRLALRWYSIAAILFVALLMPAGFVFFSRHTGGQVMASWQWPWVGTVLATAGMLVMMPVLAFLEACGRVAEVARFRVVQAIGANLALWLALLWGAGLAAAAVFAVTNMCIAGFWLLTSQRTLLANLLAVPATQKIDWRVQIWPYQWRIAVSWLSGYCIFQLFVPILFAYHGPVEAGRMGMGITLAGAIAAFGMSWLTTKAPRFGMLVSLRQFEELNALFARAVKQTVYVSTSVAILLMSMVGLLNLLQHPLATRLLSPLPFALLLAATAINVVVSAEATYLRAFKKEPFLVISVLSALFVGVCTCSVGRAYGAVGMMAGYLLINSAVGLGLGSWIFFRCRRDWLAELTSISPSAGN